MTERPAVHSKTTGGHARQQPGRRQPGVVPWDNIDSRIPGGGAWEHPVENSGRGGRARTPVEDDPKLSTGSASTWKFPGRRARTPVEDDPKLSTGSASTWKFPGRRALENIDSKNTGRVAQRKRCFRVFQQPASVESIITPCRVIGIRLGRSTVNMVETKIQQIGDVTVVEISGHLLLGDSLSDAENSVNRLIDGGTRKLVIDLARLDHMD